MTAAAAEKNNLSIIRLPISGNTIRFCYTIKGSFVCVYISVVVAIAAVVSGGIIEAPFFNNYTTLRTNCKRT